MSFYLDLFWIYIEPNFFGTVLSLNLGPTVVGCRWQSEDVDGVLSSFHTIWGVGRWLRGLLRLPDCSWKFGAALMDRQELGSSLRLGGGLY